MKKRKERQIGDTLQMATNRLTKSGRYIISPPPPRRKPTGETGAKRKTTGETGASNKLVQHVKKEINRIDRQSSNIPWVERRSATE